jgi:hypothetical protein
MGNVVFMRPFLLEGSGSAISATVGNAIAPRLLTIQPQEAWVGLDGGSGVAIEVALDAGHAPLPWDGVFWGAHNHWINATRRARRATSAGGLNAAAGNDDSGTASVYPPSGRPAATDYPPLVTSQDWRGLDHFYRFPTAAARSHFRLNLAETDNPNPAGMRAGLLRLGTCFQPSRNFGFNWKDVPRNASRATQGDTGAFDGASGPRWREIHLTMGWLRHEAPPAESDWMRLRELLIWANNVRDIVVVMDPDADRDRHIKTICGVPINGIEFINQFVKTFRSDLVIRALV